jgi:cleavage and polyadenylation specificity factor subunit 2
MTLPVQAMARIATTEDVEGMREEEDIGDQGDTQANPDALSDLASPSELQPSGKLHKKYVATAQEVHDAFDSVNTLRYSQPTHLQGRISAPLL